MTLRAAVYARVSTEEQATSGTSVGTQRERCRAHIETNGWEPAGEFVDEGVSGALANRPALDALLGACDGGAIDVVVIHDLDRLGRDLLNVLLVKRRLDGRGVRLELLTTPELSPLELQIRGAFAEEERRKIRERTVRGMLAAGRQGRWLGGPPPFGYRVVPFDEIPNAKRLELDPDECTVLRRAYELIVEHGMTTWQASAWLNANGLRPRRASRWDHINLRRVLQSEYLGGTWRWNRGRSRFRQMGGNPVTVEIPPVFAAEEYEALQGALRATSTGPRGAANVYPLSGRLTGVCGGPFHGVYRRDRDLRQYRCRNQRPEAEYRCADRRINANAIEAAVWAEVTGLLLEPDRLVRMLDDYLQLRPTELDLETDGIASLDAQVVRVERALANATAHALKADLDAGALQLATTELNAELVQLRRDRELAEAWRADSAQRARQIADLRDLAAVAHDRLERMDLVEQREVLALLDVRVTVLGYAPKGALPQLRLEGRLPYHDLVSYIGHPDNDGIFTAPSVSPPFSVDLT